MTNSAASGDVPRDRDDEAKQIALETIKRRAAGDPVSDEQVIEKYPHLADVLREQFQRLQIVQRGAHAAHLQTMREVPEILTDAIDPTPSRPPRTRRDDLRLTLREVVDEPDIRSTLVEHSGRPQPVVEKTPAKAEAAGETRPFRPTVRPPMAILKFYYDSLRGFHPYPLMSDTFLIGRREGDLIIPHDLRISQRHLEIRRTHADNTYRWHLHDLGSTNGTFVRVDRAALRDGSELLLGQERYRFLLRNGRAGLVQVGSEPETPWWFESSNVWIGRDIACPLGSLNRDEFMNAKHATLQSHSADRWVIKDVGSLNGTWFRVQSTELHRNAVFQIGEQRLGFWCP